MTAARFASPSGLAWSAAAQALFVTDSQGRTVRRIDLNAMMVSTWLGDPSVGGGFAGVQPFSQATLYTPRAPVIAGAGLALIGETGVYFARPAIGLQR